MRIRTAAAALTLAAATTAAAGCTTTDPEPELVHCPTEDSCEVDYRDGGWWIRTVDDRSDDSPGPWVRVTR